MTDDFEPPLFDLPPVPVVAPGLIANPNTPDDSPWPPDVFSMFTPMSFDFIMADPPWHFGTRSDKGQGKGAARHYRTWTLRKIRDLPVGTLASGDCVLFLWGTSPLLLDADHPSRSPIGEVLEAWGFRYGALGGWAKRTTLNNRPVMGTGYVMRSTMEPFFIATTGSPEHSRGMRNLINGKAREHSAKPEASYKWCEEYMPHARRLEICARRTRPRWMAWGDQVGLLDAKRGQHDYARAGTIES